MNRSIKQKTSVVKHYKQWEREHSHLSSVERKYWAAQKQMLATTSLKDLIK
jgi:hypothetical protein